MKLGISQPMYFPWIGLIEQIIVCDKFVFYNDVEHSKGSLLNRVKIKTPNGFTWISVPFEKKNKNKLINKKSISLNEPWKLNQINSLKENYKNAPYINDAIQIMEKVFSTKTKLVFNLAINSIIEICNYFEIEIKTKLTNSENLSTSGRKGERVLNICKELNCNTYVTGHGAFNYLDHKRFQLEKVDVFYMNYQKSPYKQLHGNFYPFVSTLDLIANCGKEGIQSFNPQIINWKNFNK